MLFDLSVYQRANHRHETRLAPIKQQNYSRNSSSSQNSFTKLFVFNANGIFVGVPRIKIRHAVKVHVYTCTWLPFQLLFTNGVVAGGFSAVSSCGGMMPTHFIISSHSSFTSSVWILLSLRISFGCSATFAFQQQRWNSKILLDCGMAKQIAFIISFDLMWKTKQTLVFSNERIERKNNICFFPPSLFRYATTTSVAIACVAILPLLFPMWRLLGFGRDPIIQNSIPCQSG